MSMHYLTAVVSLILVVAILLIRLASKWGNGRPCKARLLPPGSRGLPLLGETLEFFTAAPTLELLPFLKRRLDRYGPIFVTSLVGEEMIVSLDPAFSARVLQQEERAFQIWYPSSFMRVFGADNIINALGPLHRHIRSLVLRLFGPESLRRALLHDVQSAARDELQSWLHRRQGVEVRAATSRMIFSVTAKKLISHDDAASGGSMWKCFDACTRGLLAFPLCVPGTAFYKCMQGRKNVMRTLKQQLDERRNAAVAIRETVDFFDLVIDEMDRPDSELNENIALDLLFLLLFASHETTSMGLTAILKFLSDNPKALQELTEEHEGYTIPEGSKIMICPSAAHLNTEGTPEPVGGSKDFMAFGGGLRLCVGADFAKLQMATFLHCLVIKYRWEAISGGRMVYYPGLRFPDGFHIRLLVKD
ncbi:hypothetical protein PR202_gb11525 [Eleusine coracana subsp. coracana]|uniref:Uncharacterized protein n=1 Tax=Eleusine coracana subsp. coracana TaxID=191504 RepID=A0AAV5EKD8_ELECO|nr:hypothetical protein PR202_gb11503 [Eleusine coracana subsp. coracana]GJN23838.1 hypothetical protein PR202_gb11525 [Eleusine coracana subsp. coracana]